MIHIWGTFVLVGYKVIFGSFVALISKWPVSQTQLVVEQNGVKLGLRDASNTYMGYILLFRVQDHLGVIRCTHVKTAYNPKWLVVEQNLWESGTLVTHVYGVHLTV